MLKHLRIENIILIEQAHIPFSTGLNVLTGETGSGKSAIMHGLSLAIGERADTSIVRKGNEKGVVEAIFDIDRHPSLQSFLREAGIDHEDGQELIIRREISLSGKGRIYINHQAAQLHLLRQLGQLLVQIVGQHANQMLFSTDQHRSILDLYGDSVQLGEAFSASFAEESRLRQELANLINQEAQRLREIDVCQRELEELEEAHLQEAEEEDLFVEYTRLANSQELTSKVYEISQSLAGERAILSTLSRHKHVFDSMLALDANLKETANSFNNAVLELQEIAHTLRQYQSRIQHDPERLAMIHERLSLITRLKRKYGNTISDIKAYQEQAKIRLAQLENADLQIEILQENLKNAQEKSNQLAHQLTDKRQQSARLLEAALTEQLHLLNMSKAEFLVAITPQKRTSSGDNKIEFFLRPNVGEHEIPLKEGASGGEISRVLLALQTLLAGKEKTPTLIFDEVDASIGGKTATIIGSKLKQIGEQHQVICITHFSQVAAQAHHHIQISKQEKEGRTFTSVKCLDSASKQQELERMLGGKKIALGENKKKLSPSLLKTG